VAASDKAKWKRTINQLRFLHEDLEFVQAIAKQAGADFQHYYEDFCRDRQIDIKELNKSNATRIKELYTEQEPSDNNEQPPRQTENETAIVVHDGQTPDYEVVPTEYQMTQDELEVHVMFSKLFKRLALKIHPDKLDNKLTEEEKNDMIGAFKEVNRAFKERKYFILLDYADQYNIATPRNYKQQNRWMKREINKLIPILDHEKKSYNYLFSECDTDAEKNQVMRQFIAQVFNIHIPQKNSEEIF